VIHAIDLLLCGLAVSCALAGIVAYLDLPERAPMYTGFNGRPSRERIPKYAYLIGLIPLLLLTGLFTLSALANAPGLPPRLQVAETAGDLLVLLLAWWAAAMVWNIGEHTRGGRSRLPRLVMPYGPYAIVSMIVLGMVAYSVIH
jgi:hypothetical protein